MQLFSFIHPRLPPSLSLSLFFYEVWCNSMKEVFNVAPAPLGCLQQPRRPRPRRWCRCGAAEALQAALLLFTAALRIEMSRSTHKQRLHANITVPLLTRGRLQLHYVPGVNIQRASASPL